MTNAQPDRASKADFAWCVVATFGAYFCMYGFRKPFTVAGFEDVSAWGWSYKPLAVASQIFGYAASKFIGIKVIAELEPKRRVGLLVALIGAAQLALVGFALTPPPWNIAWLFLNGLPLGLVFGLVLGFLEGRRHTEALAAGLCTSFIVADGVTKSTGARLLGGGVSEFWMPALTGLLFAIPFAAFAWMLTRIPPPTPSDVSARSERAPMDQARRREFFRRYGVGLTLLIAMFVLVTVLRSVRSDFMPEVWAGLGVEKPGDAYAWTEIIVAFPILALNGAAILIAANRKAFSFAMMLAIVGPLVVLLASAGLRWGLPPFAFMVLQGVGLYLPYIAVHTTIFERLVAMTRERANIGYLMYLADACGYLGYFAVLMGLKGMSPADNFFAFYERMCVAIAIACIALLIPCWKYFDSRAAMHQDDAPTAAKEIGDWAEAEGRT